MYGDADILEMIGGGWWSVERVPHILLCVAVLNDCCVAIARVCGRRGCRDIRLGGITKGARARAVARCVHRQSTGRCQSGSGSPSSWVSEPSARASQSRVSCPTATLHGRGRTRPERDATSTDPGARPRPGRCRRERDSDRPGAGLDASAPGVTLEHGTRPASLAMAARHGCRRVRAGTTDARLPGATAVCVAGPAGQVSTRQTPLGRVRDVEHPAGGRARIRSSSASRVHRAGVRRQ